MDSVKCSKCGKGTLLPYTMNSKHNILVVFVNEATVTGFKCDYCDNFVGAFIQ